MSNSVNLSLDVTKTGIQNPLIKVRQGDGGFETLRTTVTANGEPMDLQGCTITFMGTTAGNHKIVDGNVTLVEAPNGIFDYTPSKAWGMDIGEFKIAYFKFVKGDGSASSANFRVNVIEAVDLTQEEARNYISVVDTTIAEINQHLTDSLAHVTQSIADANNNANTVAGNVNSLGKRVDDYNSKLAAIKVGGRNLIVRNGELVGKMIASDGKISSFNGSSVTPAIITVQPGDPLTMQGTNGGDNTFRYAFYDKDGNTLVRSYVDHMSPSTTIMAPNNAVTFRISYPTDSQVKLERGNVPTDWTPAPEDVMSQDAQLVHKTGTETIAGYKTFTSPINGQLSGNAATATKWQTARTLALTGDVNGSVAMDGSGNVSISTTGANLVHKSGSETVSGDKTFTGQLKVSGDNYTNTASVDVNYLGATISFVRIGKLVTLTSGVSTFNTNVSAGLTSGVIPNGFKPAVQQNISPANQSGASNFFSFDQGGGIYSYGTYPSGAQPRLSWTYITTDAWPV